MAVISTASRPWSKFNRHGWSKFGRRQHIYDYKTDPVDVATVCSGPGKSFRPCEATFQMSYDGRAATVTKNGQKWLDDTMIGGAEYTITLEAESTTGTTRKVER